MSNAHAVVLPHKLVVCHDKETVAIEPRMPFRPAKRADRAERVQACHALERVVASRDFDASRRSRDLLRFLVEETLAGRGVTLTQARIATRVFGRREDFDALVDPIVRIQAGRLRRSLERYYLLSGANDALRIEVPRGTYVPVFCPHAQEAAAPVERSHVPRPATPTADWPTVAVGRLDAATPGSEQDAWSARLGEMLVLELGRYADVRALLQSELDQHGPLRHARFSLGVRIREEDGDLRVTARLVDHATGAQIWGDEYHTLARPDRWSGPLDDIACVIAARVGGEEGVVVQLFAGEHRKLPPVPTTPYGAILLSYRFVGARDANSVAAALYALQQVVEEQPECHLAWTALAHLCLANHAFDVSGVSTPIDEAINHAQRAVRVDPASRRARTVLAASLLVKGELAAARRELDEALHLSPGSLVYLEMIGSLLSLLGDGERGPALVRSARERNPHCLPHGSFGLWFDHMRRGELQAAYEEALEYRDPTYFWRALMRACCLAHLGRAAEAKSAAAEVLRGKPDFALRGRVLIGHFIKDPEVMGRIVDGLAKAGLKLA